MRLRKKDGAIASQYEFLSADPPSNHKSQAIAGSEPIPSWGNPPERLFDCDRPDRFTYLEGCQKFVNRRE